MLHGVERYVIEGEGVLEGGLLPKSAANALLSVADPMMTPEKRLLAPKRTFCRLFPEASVLPDAAALIELGLAMETEDGQVAKDSSIAAGFTYFGQFVDHDITFDQTQLTIGGEANPNETPNHRSPALDLDSVYGGGPAARPELYEADGATLKIGVCAISQDGTGAEIGALPHDLPRRGDRVAVIGDKRNDENLALAQLHLAFLKFHNSFVREFQGATPSLTGDRLFARAREATIKHYQRIVLTEFLPRVIDPNALEFILSHGHRFFKPEQHDHMPIEFSVAAFRMGHSMIRPTYEWNRVFTAKATPSRLAEATLSLLFEFTQFSGSDVPGDSPFFGAATLPSNWIVDWRLMFDIDGAPPAAGLSVNRARPIDTQLSLKLNKLPEFSGAGETQPALFSLASRNLLRGRLVKLPNGLEVADAIAAAGLPHNKLTEDQLRGGPHGAKLADVGLLNNPPLWYYILREAETSAFGTLGPVGSAIIAETIVAHIRKADVSVLEDPAINQIQKIPRYTMSDLLNRIGDLNPIG